MSNYNVNESSHKLIIGGATMSDIPMVFWKYYDQYRRKLITLDDFSKLTELPKRELRRYLREILEQ